MGALATSAAAACCGGYITVAIERDKNKRGEGTVGIAANLLMTTHIHYV